jgi:hypothetical protein
LAGALTLLGALWSVPIEEASMEEQASTRDPDRDEAETTEPTHDSAGSGSVPSDWPRVGNPNAKTVRERATAVFRRPPAQFDLGSAHPVWSIEDTEEHETIEPEPFVPGAGGEEPALSPMGVQSRPVAPTTDFEPPRQRRWSGRRSIAVAVLVALTAAGAMSIALRYNSGPVSDAAAGTDARTASNFPTPAGSGPAPGPSSGRIVSAPLKDLNDREFDVLTGTSTVTVSSADLGDRLFVVSTPADGNALPSAVVDDTRVQLHLVPSGTNGPGAVAVKLSSRVRWHLRLSGGAVEHLIDMTAGRLSGIDINGGATRIELWLPATDGTIPIQMTGGVNQFLLHLPEGVPVRVRVRSGASSVEIDALNRSAISPGTVFTPAGWDGATNRYDVDAVAGFAVLRVDRGGAQ